MSWTLILAIIGFLAPIVFAVSVVFLHRSTTGGRAEAGVGKGLGIGLALGALGGLIVSALVVGLVLALRAMF